MVDYWACVGIAFFTQNDTSYAEHFVYVYKTVLYTGWCNMRIKDSHQYGLLFQPAFPSYHNEIRLKYCRIWTVLTLLQESASGQRSHILRSVPQIFMLDS